MIRRPTFLFAPAIRFMADQRGSTAVEYSVIIGVVFMMIVAAIQTFSDENGEMFNEISSAVQAR